MKKHVKLIGLAALVISLMLVFAACDSVNYGGKFTEVTDKAAAQQIVDDVGGLLDNIDKGWQGYKVVADYEMSMGSDAGAITTKMSGTGYLTFNDGKIEMSASFKLSVNAAGEKESGTMKIYIKDNTMYFDSKSGKESLKYKTSGIDLDGSQTQGLDIAAALDSFYESAGNTIVSVTSESGARNIKISDDSNAGIYIVFSVDKDGAVKGIKLTIDYTLDYDDIFSYSMKMKGTFTYQPYSGAVSFPKDLDSYTNLGSDA